MPSKTFAGILLLVLLSLVCKSSAIYCYDCNSANNSACLDLNELDDEVRARIIPIVDCSKFVPQTQPVNFFCRKIVQTIYHSRCESDVRVTRGCGWKTSEKPCYRIANSDHVETVCQCYTDHCNSSQHVSAEGIVVLFMLLCAVLSL